MMRTVKTPDERRREILNCAMKLFASQGYDGTSVNQIIAMLGISKGAFYHHFSAKEDLLEGLAVSLAEFSALEARHVLEDETLDSFARLSAFLSVMRQTKLNAAPDLHAAFEAVFRDENLQLFHRTHDAVVSVVLPILTKIIAEGVAEQTFDTSDPKQAAETILFMMGSTRPLIVGITHAKSHDEVTALADQLYGKLVFLGTIVDRILGLPEGSVVLADTESVRVLTSTWQETVNAA